MVPGAGVFAKRRIGFFFGQIVEINTGCLIMRASSRVVRTTSTS
jgi:hypothetical protein